MSFFKSINSRSLEQGFSLVELMIVVAIIGVLASLAVPKFQVFQAKAKQSEAKNNLSHIYTLEQTYYGDNDAYGTVLQIGFSTQGGNGANAARYGYVAAPGVGTFIGTATARSNTNIASSCTFLDTWTINQTKTMLNTRNCAI